MKSRIFAVAFVTCLSSTPAALALDQNLPLHKPITGISGQIKSVGSDTLDREMELWARGFRELYPDVKIVIEGKGSATAPRYLQGGTVEARRWHHNSQYLPPC
jgi:phosphate transport system substrate-binding protein